MNAHLPAMLLSIYFKWREIKRNILLNFFVYLLSLI